MAKRISPRFLQAFLLTLFVAASGLLMGAEGRLEGFLFVAFFVIIFVAALIVQFRRKDD
ncbi:MAG: hypothetical protein HC867_01985 [Bacteroidia bacterium]|nr:hypothetical protein [Bacteroidia bacterium]